MRALQRVFTRLLLALAATGAQAQALNPTWDGDWLAVESSQGAAGERLRIARTGAESRLTAGDRSCLLAYDDTITPQAVLQRIQELRAWQLDPAHWPAGTQPAQLIGLAREFDKAQAALAGIAPGAYRRVRLKGPGCENPRLDTFLLLHKGQELYRLGFPQEALGVAVASFRRQR